MTTQSKHTPAPWKTVGDWIVTSGQGDINIDLYQKGSTVEDMNNARANARLIAAAPELLSALESAAFALETIINLQGRAELVPYLQQAQAAITKARGE